MFYAGHAELKGTSYIALQDGLFPLEKKIREFSENTYTEAYSYCIGVFDACRNISRSQSFAYRGNNEINYSEGLSNRILIFSCGPNQKTPEKSTLTWALIEKLNKHKGYLPDAVFYFNHV